MERRIMDLNEYQYRARQTAIYPEDKKVFYPAMGLAGEAGEILNKLKKVWRDNLDLDDPEVIATVLKEAGDCLWYVANLIDDLGYTLGEVALANIHKLEDRQNRGVLGGSGDNR